MKKTFYSHLIEIKELEVELDSLNLKKEEKEELLSHIHSSIHYKVLDVIFSDLSEEDRKILIDHINNGDHEKVWEHLLRTFADAQETIKNASRLVIKEFNDEIAKLKKV